MPRPLTSRRKQTQIDRASKHKPTGHQGGGDLVHALQHNCLMICVIILLTRMFTLFEISQRSEVVNTSIGQTHPLRRPSCGSHRHSSSRGISGLRLRVSVFSPRLPLDRIRLALLVGEGRLVGVLLLGLSLLLLRFVIFFYTYPSPYPYEPILFAY